MKNIRNHFKEVYGLKRDQIEKIIKVALSSVEGLLSSAEEALEKKDREKLLITFHTIKTNFLSMGLNELGKLAEQIERHIKNNNLEVDALFQKIKTMWGKIIKK